jgi:uncharacterized membrane protein
VYTFILIPYDIAFNKPRADDTLRINGEVTIDVIIILDIIITFFTDNGEAFERAEMTNGKIARKYITTYFIFDLLASVPGLIYLE